ncbi:hypothetical protein OZX57_02970 [Bifidobacterium sp. ESL0682]|uniref:hypothetical protein n=1 Tax=Bifidobacterium sp. ESL0682 TaxID=2983212 RepID=UPI0023F83E2B|nr:hypothetical protein [Bifidobacterium sp. ESL0682]WEV42432.1 hypothetical protein OZX57_02970 [Bifidobacterium sp. ESL0682]
MTYAKVSNYLSERNTLGDFRNAAFTRLLDCSMPNPTLEESIGIILNRAALNPTFHVISPVSWAQNAFAEYFDKAHMTNSSHRTANFRTVEAEYIGDTEYGGTGSSAWNLACDYGFQPEQNIADEDAVWIAPDLLIALNAWRRRHNMPSLLFEAPTADWLSSLPVELTGRKAVTTTVSDIQNWTAFPKRFGERPWSQLGNGRVPEFRAARRTLPVLQHDLQNAPDDSSISINTHIPSITEEWCIIIHNGIAVASSGYCIHTSDAPESHDILTVFDGAQFHEEYRALAESQATAAAQISQLNNASIIVGFRDLDVMPTDKAWANQNKSEVNTSLPDTHLTTLHHSSIRSLASETDAVPDTSLPSTSAQSPAAFVIEADPIWCTTPYPFHTAEETHAFLQAIADSRIQHQPAGTSQTQSRHSQTVQAENVYSPDPWMVRHNAHRYDAY